MKNLERKVLLGLLLGVGIYAAMAIWADVDAVASEVLGFNAWFFVLALILSLGNYALRFLKWQFFLQRVNVRVPPGESALAFLASFLLTVTPGKVGEVVKSWLLKKSRGIPIAVTAPIVVAERVTDLLALLIIAFVGLSAYAYGVEALLVSGAVVLGGVVVISSAPIMHRLIDLFGRVPVVGARMGPRLHVAYQSMRTLIAPRPLIIATGLSVAGWGLECLAFHWIIGAFPGAAPSVLAASFLYAVTTILGALSFLPGGLGVTEGSMSVGLVELGLLPTESVAVATTYLIRLATLWFAVALGMVAFGIYRRRYLKDDDVPAPAALEGAENANGG